MANAELFQSLHTAVSLHADTLNHEGAPAYALPNADRTTFVTAGAFPAWQARRVCQSVLSTLVGFD